VKHSPGDAGGFGPRTIPPPPVTYQGGKRRLAPAILDAIRPDPAAPFSDLCCGGGAVALEAVRRGHPPALVTLVDAGPWGEVWRDVGAGRFPLATLRALLADLPSDGRVPEHLRWLARQPVVAADRPAVFLVLQAGSWGGRPVGWDGERWRHRGFRGPCGASCPPVCAKHPLLAPHPSAIFARISQLCEALVGARGLHADVLDARPAAGFAYLDPPYADTARYPAGTLNASAYAASLSVPCWVSERAPLTPNAIALLNRHPGGITGGHTAQRTEWLSLFAGAAPPRTPLPLTSGVSAASPTESENR